MKYDPANAARCRWEHQADGPDVHRKTPMEEARNPYAAPKHYRMGHPHDQHWLKWWLAAYKLPIDDNTVAWFERQMAGRNHYELDKAIPAFMRRIAAREAQSGARPASDAGATADRAAALRAELKPARRRPPPSPAVRPPEAPGSPHRPASRSDHGPSAPARAHGDRAATTGGVELDRDAPGDSYPEGSIIGASSGTLPAHSQSTDGGQAGHGERGNAKAPSAGALSVDVDGIPPPSDADWEGQED